MFEFKMLDVPLYIPPKKDCGFANRLIHLTDFFNRFPNGVVHESIKDYGVGRWFDLHFPLTSETMSTCIVTPDIYINPDTFSRVHSRISTLVTPNKELQDALERHAVHLLDGVKIGLHIRRGLFSSDHLSEEIVGFASDASVCEFKKISELNNPVYVASDSESLKKEHFSKCRYLDAPITSILSDDKLNTFLDFLLLSKCPVVYGTGGDANGGGISSFGYMAACYGRSQLHLIKTP